jgi:hypothetical protein
MCNSIPRQVRAAREREWLRRYCALLDENGAGTQRATEACQQLQSVELLQELLA